jgi:MerR family transcriptional regulator, redox-sensitive transcriptional activator SoxR
MSVMRSQRPIATASISQVARQFGLRTSALRYYEQIGLLRPIPRVAGERRYDRAAIERLAVIAAGRRAGLSIKEIGGLFSRLRSGTSADQAWRELSTRKIEELEQLKQRIGRTQDALRRLRDCKCSSIEMCGEKLRARLTRI